MKEIMTEATDVEGEVSIWAIPRRYPSEDNPQPFDYKIINYAYEQGAVKVVTHNIKLPVPAGINLFEKALDTLEAAKETAHQAYMEQIRNIDEQIQQLQLIGYTPPAQRADIVLPPEEEETLDE